MRSVLVVIIFSIFLSSCDMEVHSAKRCNDEFKVPILLDNRANESLPKLNSKKFGNAYYPIVYVGDYEDSISISYLYSYIPAKLPPPAIVVLSDSTLKYKKSKRIDEERAKRLKHLELVNPYFTDDYSFDCQQYSVFDSLQLIVDTSQTVGNWSLDYQIPVLGYPVLINNSSKDTVCVGFGELSIRLQAQDTSGYWQDIEKGRMIGCGTGVPWLFIPSQKCLVTLVPVYNGVFETKLRLRIGNKYSNEFRGNINLSQFIQKE